MRQDRPLPNQIANASDRHAAATEANAIVAPIHPKAMPVILPTPAEVDRCFPRRRTPPWSRNGRCQMAAPHRRNRREGGQRSRTSRSRRPMRPSASPGFVQSIKISRGIDSVCGLPAGGGSSAGPSLRGAQIPSWGFQLGFIGSLFRSHTIGMERLCVRGQKSRRRDDLEVDPCVVSRRTR
jgi:hypothetical protein